MCCTARLAESAAWLAIVASLFSAYELGRSSDSIKCSIHIYIQPHGHISIYHDHNHDPPTIHDPRQSTKNRYLLVATSRYARCIYAVA